MHGSLEYFSQVKIAIQTIDGILFSSGKSFYEIKKIDTEFFLIKSLLGKCIHFTTLGYLDAGFREGVYMLEVYGKKTCRASS